MKICIFLGPTLSANSARSILDVVYKPPVAQGDVAKAVREGANVIGIIDGYFENVPSVWHKEILFAMRSGVHVLGCSSMGALRAAELAPFGMEGVGSIFEAFHSGELEDDDEVAVIHGPEELGYPALSEAMVNIRRTLSDAFAHGIIDAETRQGLERIAKTLHYRDRRWSRILDLAGASDAPEPLLSALKLWLPEGRTDQKWEDAIEMLQLIKARFAQPVPPKAVAYHFETTTLWAATVEPTAQQQT